MIEEEWTNECMVLQNDTDLLDHCQVMVCYFLLIDQSLSRCDNQPWTTRDDKASRLSSENKSGLLVFVVDIRIANM